MIWTGTEEELSSFVEDIFMIWTGTEEEVSSFFERYLYDMDRNRRRIVKLC